MVKRPRSGTHLLGWAVIALASLVGGSSAIAQPPDPSSTPHAGPAAAPDDAREDAASFVRRAEAELEALARPQERAAYRNGTDESHGTAISSTTATEAATYRRHALARQAAEYDVAGLASETARKLAMIRMSETIPTASDPVTRQELAEITDGLVRNYLAAASGVGQSPARTKSDLYRVLRESRDPTGLLVAWSQWQAPARAIRGTYARMVEIANEGARELGYPDMGAMWRSHYDMPSEALLAEYDRLWKQVEPLYLALHCHVRAKLREKYGDLVPERGPIPAHLLGNMWAQEWTGIEDLVRPGGSAPSIDITGLLRDRHYTPYQMVSTAEQFFTSLGFEKLPALFWRRSTFVMPQGSMIDGHGSAWPIDPRHGDVRLQMNIEVNERDFKTIYHELGHIYYFLACAQQPFLFQDGPNPGFHEAVGDAMTLSITPEYLEKIGLLDRLPAESEDLPYLFHTALDKVPRLAMAIVVDTWRWKVFSGEIPPERYNAEWWALRRKYQGVSPPSPRNEDDFDAGMFYHVSYNIPYDRYFTALMLQFDFHRALCETAGCSGCLHRGSIYGSPKAGQRLRKALALGASRPWPDALEQLTGKRAIDASSVVRYFAPVMAWLERENQGRQPGW